MNFRKVLSLALVLSLATCQTIVSKGLTCDHSKDPLFNGFVQKPPATTAPPATPHAHQVVEPCLKPLGSIGTPTPIVAPASSNQPLKSHTHQAATPQPSKPVVSQANHVHTQNNAPGAKLNKKTLWQEKNKTHQTSESYDKKGSIHQVHKWKDSKGRKHQTDQWNDEQQRVQQCHRYQDEDGCVHQAIQVIDRDGKVTNEHFKKDKNGKITKVQNVQTTKVQAEKVTKVQADKVTKVQAGKVTKMQGSQAGKGPAGVQKNNIAQIVSQIKQGQSKSVIHAANCPNLQKKA